jgi:hypothetical protein
MSADGEDKFEEALEGENFGSIDDWETQLGLMILKIEDKIEKADHSDEKNEPVMRMLERKLVTYNTALQYLDENPKAALIIGSRGGLQGIIAFLKKQAIDAAAVLETKKYSDIIMQQLPGYKMWDESPQGKTGGLVAKSGAKVRKIKGGSAIAKGK